MKQIYLISFALALLGASCISTTTNQLVSSVKPENIEELAILAPFTEIRYTNKDTRGLYSEEFSQAARKNLLKAIPEVMPLDLSYQIYERSPLEEELLGKEIYQLVNEVEHKKNIKTIKIKPGLVSLLSLYEENYIMGFVLAGFGKSNLNEDERRYKPNAYGTLFISTIPPEDFLPRSTLICFIIDKQNKNLAYYRKQTMYEREPADKKVTDVQMSFLIRKYFRKREDCNDCGQFNVGIFSRL
jgi:hypothetical protein